MYGLVNLAVRDLVVSRYSEDVWNSICDEAKSPTRDFVSMQYYADAVTYALVAAASKQLRLPAETILREFGKHWILYTAKMGYGPLMDLFGVDFKTCLMNLNNLHARMGLTLPELSPPRFQFDEIDLGTYQIEYHSSRQGLSPMMQGLLEGLATRYGVHAAVELLPDRGDFKTFQIKILE